MCRGLVIGGPMCRGLVIGGLCRRGVGIVQEVGQFLGRSELLSLRLYPQQKGRKDGRKYPETPHGFIRKGAIDPRFVRMFFVMNGRLAMGWTRLSGLWPSCARPRAYGAARHTARLKACWTRLSGLWPSCARPRAYGAVRHTARLKASRARGDVKILPSATPTKIHCPPTPRESRGMPAMCRRFRRRRRR